mmetsp:Transcript_91153/g.283366  ORF Transcript_91153/g.283366 Transcript_91153/m.283366 type:complete len:353 (-) Transcript_91153:147-1205(-)
MGNWRFYHARALRCLPHCPPRPFPRPGPRYAITQGPSLQGSGQPPSRSGRAAVLPRTSAWRTPAAGAGAGQEQKSWGTCSSSSRSLHASSGEATCVTARPWLQPTSTARRTTRETASWSSGLAPASSRERRQSSTRISTSSARSEPWPGASPARARSRCTSARTRAVPSGRALGSRDTSRLGLPHGADTGAVLGVTTSAEAVSGLAPSAAGEGSEGERPRISSRQLATESWRAVGERPKVSSRQLAIESWRAEGERPSDSSRQLAIDSWRFGAKTVWIAACCSTSAPQASSPGAETRIAASVRQTPSSMYCHCPTSCGSGPVPPPALWIRPRLAAMSASRSAKHQRPARGRQ